MKKYYLYNRSLHLIFFVAICMASLCSEVALAQTREVKQGSIRVKVSEQLAASLEASSMARSSDNKLHTGIVKLDAVNTKHNVSNMRRIFPPAGKFEARHRKHGLHLWYEVVMDKDISIHDAVKHYKDLEQIEKAEPIYKKALIGADQKDFGPRVVSPVAGTTLAGSPDDPSFPQQWHYNNTGQTGGTPHADINLLKAWQIETGKRNVIVAITDGGIDIAHNDLSGNIWVNTKEIADNEIDDDNNGYVDDIHGYSFVNNTGVITPVPHGTHVAGTIAASTNNGIGVSGVAGGSGSDDGVQLMSCQVFNASGDGDGFAMTYVYGADNGAVISQNSWGYTQAGVWEDAVLAGIDYFIAEAGKDENGNQTGPMNGGIVIFAAGNSTSSGEYYPGYYEPVLSVSATGHEDLVTYYSNYGSWVDIAAPGGETTVSEKRGVLSTLPDNKYGYYQGTSMACPHVSGVAALVVSKFGGAGFTPAQLRDRLVGTSDYIDDKNPDFAGMLGAGRVNAFSALQDNDNAGPDAITDLHSTIVKAKSLTVSFTAPADAGNEKASHYDVLYSTSPITPDNYSEASMLGGYHPAHEAGTEETITIDNLNSATAYYIVIRSADIFSNYSDLSTVLKETTYALPVIEVSPSSLSASLLTADVAVKTLSISNTGAGPLEFSISKDIYMTDYVSFSPTEGTVAAGKSLNVDVTFDAHKLFGSDYDQTLMIASNDSVTTQVFVPLTLSVTDNNASIASLDPASFDFGSVYLGLQKTKTIHLYNDGTDTLRITGVSSNNSLFTSDFKNVIKIPPFKEGRLTVAFKITTTTAASGILTISTNDPTHATLKVNLAGHGATPPALAITPESLEASLATAETATQSLTLANTGAGELTYSVHAIPGKNENIFTKQITIIPSVEKVSVTEVIRKHPRVAGTEPQTIIIKSSRESSKPVKVLILSPDNDASDFGRLMAGYKDVYVRVLQPDYLESLTAASLVNIDVIIVTNNSGWSSYTTAEKAGDLLADYVDAGGKVIIGNLAYADDDYFKLKGRFINEHYGPFEPAIGSAWNSVALGDLISPAHPLLEDVSKLNYDGNIYDVGLADGSTAIARWSTGELLMATNDNVVGVNVLASVESSYFPWSGDIPTLYHNAINWLAGSSMIRVDAPSGILAAADQLDLQVTFDAADLVGGTYANSIYLTTDVPGKELVEIPATLIVRAPDFVVNKDSVWTIVSKGSTITKTITLTNNGADTHSYTVKSKDNGIAPPTTTTSAVPGSEEESSAVATRTAPYSGPAYDLASSKISLAKPVPATVASTYSAGAVFSTDFESYVRGDISMSGDGWVGQYGNWTTHIANPAAGIKHMRGLSDGYGSSLAQSPYLFYNEQPYATTTMKVNMKGSGVTWQIIPFSALDQMVVTRLHFDADGTLQVLVNDGTATPKFQTIDVVVPDGYFNVTIEVERSTADFKIYFDNHEVFRGTGFAGDIQGVSFYSEMEVSGPTLDIDDFFIIDGQKELIPNYLTISPISGTLAAGESKDITLTFDATEMIFGSYQSDVTIDVERVEQLTVPVITDVVGDAELTVDDVAYTEAYHNQDTVTRFVIHNTGGAIIDYRMKLDGVDTTWLSLSTIKGSISMRDEVEVAVNFASKNLAPGTYAAKILLSSNSVTEPEHTLNVSLKVLTAPVMSISPDPVTSTVATLHKAYQPLIITNTGESPLEFSFNNLFTVETIKAAYGGESPSRDGVSVLYATGFDDFEDWADVNGQHGWQAENESWEIYHADVGPDAGDNELTGTSHTGETSTAYSPSVGKGVSPMSSMLVSLYLEDAKAIHSMWQVIPRSTSADMPVTKFQINTDRSVQIAVRNDAGEEEFKSVSYKFPQMQEVELRVDVERATSLFVLYLDGVAVFHGQGFAGDIEQVAFYASSERYDYLDIDDLIILDGVLPWLGVSPVQGTVLNGQPLEVKLLLDAQNLVAGQYTDVLSMISNDELKASQQLQVQLTVTGAPVISLDKTELASTVYRGAGKDETLTITNTGSGNLTYGFSGYEGTNSAARMGGPDSYSYYWIDSDDARGPVFDWEDISDSGTGIYLGDNDNQYVDLPFTFTFYGNTYDKVSIISDGVLGFGPGQSSLEDDPNFDIPNPDEIPNNFLAPFWDDLDPGSGGVIYYQQFADKFIIQFNEVPIFGKEEGNTFQAILYPDGRIKYQYLSVDLTGSVTIGLENNTGTDGLQITYNKPYVKDNLAIMIEPTPFWVTPSVNGNTLAGGTSETVTMHFNASNLGAGVYSSFLFVRNDDFTNPLISIPVTLTVLPAYIISGIITDHDGKPLADITLQGFPDEVKTDASGYYTASVPVNWSGTFKPISDEYHFSPAEIKVSSVQLDMNNQNFTGDIVMGIADDSEWIRVYPNPSTGTFNVTLPHTPDLHIEVYNTAGQIVFKDDTKEVTSKDYALHIPQKGMFVLVVQSKTATHVKRILVR